MADSQTPEPGEIRRKARQRLIGAIVIVLLAVVFVPMVLDPEPSRERREASRQGDPVLAIPAKEGAKPLPAPVAAKAPPASAPPEPAKVATSRVLDRKAEPETRKLSEPGKLAEPGKAAEPRKAPEPGKPVATAPAQVREAPAPKLEGFAVQVGAFRDEDKLQQARDRLAAARIAHFVERRAVGELTRLRAGPYATREAAESARARMKLEGIDGQVVPLP